MGIYSYFKWKPCFSKFLNIAFICDVLPCNLLHMFSHFRGSCCLHYCGRWSWREQDPPKCLDAFRRPYSRKCTCEWDLRFSWQTKTVFYTVLIVIAVKTSNSTHTYVFKTLYSIYKLLFYYIPEFWMLFMLFTAVLSKYFCSVVGNLLFAWFGWMYCDCRYTPGKCGSFTDQSQCLNTRPGLKCVWNKRQSMCLPISGLSHLFMNTGPEMQDTQTTVEGIYRYEKCHYWACNPFILPLLLRPYGIWVLN
jgi:hypothetical protein